MRIVFRIGSFACTATLASTAAFGQAAVPDLRAALGRTSVQPANVTHRSLQALPPARRSAVAADLIRRTWAEECRGAVLKNTQLARDGRSMWSVKCGRDPDIAFTLVLPSRLDGRAQVLKCRRDERGGSRCSAL